MLTRAICLSLTALALTQAGELHDAARVCDTARMRQLLARHPRVNEVDANGNTPLHIAIDSRQRACVALLLEAGADRKVRDRQGRTALEAVVQITDPRERIPIDYMLKNFGQKAAAGPAGPMPWTLEHTLARRETEVTKMLLELGVDPNKAGQNGSAPLADAALKGDLAAARALLAGGARLDAMSEAGTLPIHDAALGDQAAMLRELAKQGADGNARTRTEAQTPLHIAAVMGKMKALAALVEIGADLSAKDAQGRTPRMAAERVGLTEAVDFLTRAATAK